MNGDKLEYIKSMKELKDLESKIIDLYGKEKELKDKFKEAEVELSEASFFLPIIAGSGTAVGLLPIMLMPEIEFRIVGGAIISSAVIATIVVLAATTVKHTNIQMEKEMTTEDIEEKKNQKNALELSVRKYAKDNNVSVSEEELRRGLLYLEMVNYYSDSLKEDNALVRTRKRENQKIS